MTLQDDCLQVLSRSEGPLHTDEVVQRIEARTGSAPLFGSTDISLRALAERYLVSESLGPSTSERPNDTHRRVFEITPRGLEKLAKKA